MINSDLFSQISSFYEPREALLGEDIYLTCYSVIFDWDVGTYGTLGCRDGGLAHSGDGVWESGVITAEVLKNLSGEVFRELRSDQEDS